MSLSEVRAVAWGRTPDAATTQWKRVGVGMSILYQAHQDDNMAAGWTAAPSGGLAREDDRGPQGWIGGREAQPQREALWG